MEWLNLFLLEILYYYKEQGRGIDDALFSLNRKL